jgi:hypothetical protein
MVAAPMIHFHGTPITPKAQLARMTGRHFCVSFARPDSLKTCLEIGQSVMLDNGAFSAFTRGHKLDVEAYYQWLDPILAPPHFAIVPDAIGGTLEDQHSMRATWPRHTLGNANAAPVFHLHFPLTYLNELCLGWSRVCLGSSGEYWQVGSAKWCSRMDEIFNYLVHQFGRVPYIHGLRMLGQTDGGWPLASADSTNVAQNFKVRTGCAECMAERIDGQQPNLHWEPRPTQQSIFSEVTT